MILSMGKPNDFDALVGRNVRVYRVARGLGQLDVAHRMAPVHPTWTRATVSELERGRRGILVGELRDLAAVLDTSMTALLSEQVLA